MTHTRDRAAAPPQARHSADDLVGRAWTGPLVPARRTAIATSVPPSVDATLRTSGQPLDAATRRAAEAHFGLDLARVRIHSDEAAAASARAIHANAYAVGPHIVFARDRYAPTTARGRETLFHELAHVAQRGPGAPMPGGPLTLGAADSSHERAARAASGHVFSDSFISRGPTLPAHVVARDAAEDEAIDRAYLAARGLPVPAPGDTPARVKDSVFTARQVGAGSGLTAYEHTTKATVYPGSDRTAVPALGRDGTITGPRNAAGYVRSNESTYSQALTAAGVQANSKQVDSDKTFQGVTIAAKGGTRLLDGSEVAEVDAEVAIGRSEKVSRQRIHNNAATSEATTVKTFNGSKQTLNGVDVGGDFRETEVIDGKESRRTFADVRSRDASGREVARERSRRDLSTDGHTSVNLRNTGTKYQALDLSRGEILTGRRTERVEREVDHADGSRQRERSATHHRGTVTALENSARLAKGLELKIAGQSSRGLAASAKLSELSRDEAAGRAFSGKGSADASYGARLNTSFTINKPGVTPIAARVQQGSRLTGGDLGLITKSAPDSRTVSTGDKAAFNDPNKADAAGSYSESLAFSGGSRVAKTDDYEVTDRGVSANVGVEAEAGTLKSFLRKDRFNFGWLVVENAMTDYYLAGVGGKVSAGMKAGVDVNNVNANLSANLGWTRKLANETTFRMGGFFVKIKAEGDTFVGAEGALSAEAGYTRGAGAGGAAGANVFAGARVGLGGKLEGGFEGVAFAAGAYKWRGSLGFGAKANIEARYLNGYLVLAGGLALSAELGVGADIELRINPTAVGLALVKGAAKIANINPLGVANKAKKAYNYVAGLFGR